MEFSADKKLILTILIQNNSIQLFLNLNVINLSI